MALERRLTGNLVGADFLTIGADGKSLRTLCINKVSYGVHALPVENLRHVKAITLCSGKIGGNTLGAT